MERLKFVGSVKVGVACSFNLVVEKQCEKNKKFEERWN